MKSDMISKLNKDFDGASIFKASSPVKQDLDFIPFPSPSLADAAHIWGWPLGRISQLHGLPGSGKTFFAMLCVLEAQRKFPDSTCVWLDTEYQFNPQWASNLGIDNDRLLVIQENDAAKGFSQLFGRVNDKGEKSKLGIVDYILKGEFDCKFIVLDSIANLVPPVERGRNFEDQNIAALARFLPGAFNRAASDVAKANISMLCINQARVDMGSYAGGITYPGGFKYKHVLSLAIRLTGSTAKDGLLLDKDDKKIGHRILATVEKTRFGPDKYKTNFMVDFRNGVVQLGEEIANLGASYGVVQRPSNVRWVYKDIEITGKDNFFKYLDEHKDIADEIVKAVKESKSRGVKATAIAPVESDDFDDVFSE